MKGDQNFEQQLEALMAVEPRVTWSDSPPASRVSRADVRTMGILIAGGVAAMAAFLIWFFSGDRIGAAWLFWPMTAVFLYAFVLLLYEWYCYLGVRPRGPIPPPGERSVDILTTWVPGEPRDMIVSTLKAVQRITYPHTTYLCDEGDDPLMKAVCDRLGVRHVTRTEKVGAKAGNINNALKGATGEFAVVLDPDHEPAPFFLDRVLGYFDDAKVGFVQCVQGYHNQSGSLIARGAAEQTYHFYGPVMTGMHGHGTTQAIGANCTFRRSALDSIGGHAPGLAEDMATTLKLYAKGWTSVYVPETLTRGLVPNTLGGYAKQQLKWACGVWDILIESLPAAWPTLSWRNRIHFLHNGLFYLRGIFVLLAILVPILALVTGQMPWRISLLEFVTWTGPLFAAYILIRQTAQRWVMEPAEYGFHVVGSFLMNATWWVHLAGATSAMRRVRIPYIPTSKDDEDSDALLLAAPNLLLALASFGAAAYGLWWDQSPFALLMAIFAVTNALVLGFVWFTAQQKTFASLLSPRRWSVFARTSGLRFVTDRTYWFFRRWPLLIAFPTAIGLVALLASQSQEHRLLERHWAEVEARTAKEHGGFALGVYDPAMDKAAYGVLPTEQAIDKVRKIESKLGTDLSIVSLYHWWGDRAIEDFPQAELDAIRELGAVPMITWGPSLADFSWAADFEETAQNRGVFRWIVDGKLDYFIDAYAAGIREHGGPVLIRFAHEMDNPQYPWSPRGGNTPEEFVDAWRYVVQRFLLAGATNAAWVWNPWKPEDMAAYYPGNSYVDWVGLTLLNFGTVNGDGSWDSFADLYAPFEPWVKGYGKPALLAEFGSTDLGGDRTAWIADALEQIAKRNEITGLVFFDTDQDKNIPTDWPGAPKGMVIDWKIDPEAPQLKQALSKLDAERPFYQPLLPELTTRQPAENRVVRKGEGWQLMVGDAPFFMRGVAYGAGQGWRVPRDPTRLQVERDFEAIAAMGANTIRRYHPHWGDSNIFRAADAHGLKVLAGFSLLESTDYVNDQQKLDEIEAEVVDMVRSGREDPAVLMWVIGNEVWGLMKHAFAPPFLVENRKAYMRFLNRLARRIKEIDPARPVATAFEVSNELQGALHDLNQLAPDIDVIGINAYYEEHLRRLQHAVDAFGGGRPWFLSEFGPDGYWDPNLTNWSDQGFPLEPGDDEKAALYADRWKRFVEDTKPFTIGGVAFAWTDRYEGSPSWFGLTDFEGRPKPSYFALQSLWRGEATKELPNPIGLRVSMKSELAQPGESLALEVAAKAWPAACELEILLFDAQGYRVQSEEEHSCDETGIRIEAPDEEGRYWVTINATGEEGVVTSRSLPLVVSLSDSRS